MMEFLNAIGPWVVSVAVFGVPVALAWWLSDGFSSVEVGSAETLVVNLQSAYPKGQGTRLSPNPRAPQSLTSTRQAASPPVPPTSCPCCSG